jgi:hypothetical protein
MSRHESPQTVGAHLSILRSKLIFSRVVSDQSIWNRPESIQAGALELLVDRKRVSRGDSAESVAEPH